MSTNLAYARPVREPAREPHRHIEIVATREQRRARPKAVYAVVTVISLFVIFAAQLLLSVGVSQGAYEISTLQSQQKQLLRSQDSLSEKLNILSSTQNLSTQAAARGMVPNASPFAIDLASGGVFALPGSSDPLGCGGGCNLISNSLLAGVPIVTAPLTTGPITTVGSAIPGSGAGAAQTPPAAGTSLPAPVTR